MLFKQSLIDLKDYQYQKFISKLSRIKTPLYRYILIILILTSKIVLELMDGDLSSLIKDPSVQLSSQDLKFMMYQITRGVAFIHKVSHNFPHFSHPLVQSCSP